MFVTIQQRLQQLEDVRRRVDDGSIVFDADKVNFGFRRMDQLLDVSEDAIKGYPCVAYNRLSDPVKFGVKLIPLETKYPLETHPCHLEARILQDMTELVRNNETPHIAYYFNSFSVGNKKKSVVRFPLKALRDEIYKESDVLIAEYVPGGCIDEWVDEQPNITDKQWKYVIFSVAWTLYVMQDKLRLHHNDFHCGNVLIDTAIDPADKSYYQYVLQQVNGEPLVFNIQSCGVLGKIWDPEFSASYDKDRTFRNDFYDDDEEDIPQSFNPYYDLHCFLMSLLRLPIPERLRAYICSIYPKEVIPPEPLSSEYESEYSSRSRSFRDDHEHDNASTVSTASFSSGYSFPSDRADYRSSGPGLGFDEDQVESQEGYDSYAHSESERGWKRSGAGALPYGDILRTRAEDTPEAYENTYYSRHYKTDESSSDTSVAGSRSSAQSSSSQTSRTSGRTSYTSQTSRTSRIRTEFTLGDRLLNGAEKVFKLPTPFDIITSDYLAEYRKPIPDGLRKNGTQRTPACVFTYTEREHHDDYEPPAGIEKEQLSKMDVPESTGYVTEEAHTKENGVGEKQKLKRPPTPIPREIRKKRA